MPHCSARRGNKKYDCLSEYSESFVECMEETSEAEWERRCLQDIHLDTKNFYKNVNQDVNQTNAVLRTQRCSPQKRSSRSRSRARRTLILRRPNKNSNDANQAIEIQSDSDIVTPQKVTATRRLKLVLSKDAKPEELASNLVFSKDEQPEELAQKKSCQEETPIEPAAVKRICDACKSEWTATGPNKKCLLLR